MINFFYLINQKFWSFALDLQHQATNKLLVYAAAPLSAWGLSHAEINDYLQTASMGIGILVGLFALIPASYKFLKGLFKK